MAMGRTQMSKQVSTPPMKGRTNGEKGSKKRRLLPQGKEPLQGLAQCIRFGGTVKVPKKGRKKLGKLY
tara:strand:+ start:132 stop:335 length:204 start_codon:yes stop_codon:yes gene_type:complete